MTGNYNRQKAKQHIKVENPNEAVLFFDERCTVQ